MQVSHVGVNVCFIIDAATYAVAALCAYSLKVSISLCFLITNLQPSVI